MSQEERAVTLTCDESPVESLTPVQSQAHGRLAAIVESSYDVIVSKTLEGIITSWNPAAERVFGYTAEEIVGKSILTIIPPELHDQEPLLLARIARGERVPPFETIRVRKDGVAIFVSLTVSPVRDSDGRIIGASKILRDVTAQKSIEASQRFLMESSVRLAQSLHADDTIRTLADLAIETLADACMITLTDEEADARGEYPFVHVAITSRAPEYAELIREVENEFSSSPAAPWGFARAIRTGESDLVPDGMFADELLSQHAHNPRHLDLLRRLELRSGIFAPLIARGRTLGALSLLRHGPGRRPSFTEQDRRVAEELGRRAGIALDNARLFAAAHSAREHAESLASRLRASEQRLRATFASAATGLAVTTLDGRFVDVNCGYCQIVGRGERELLSGMKQVEIIHPDDLAENVMLLERLLAGEIPSFVLESRYLCADGSAVPVRKSVSLLRDDSGTPEFVVAVVEDVSERWRVEAERAQLLASEQAARREAEHARAEAEMANRAKGDFLAVMSHELRTPLNAIGGYAELLELGVRGPVTPEQIADIRRIQKSQRHLLSLINEVLNYARLEGGAVTYDVRPVSVKSVIDVTAPLVEVQLEGKKLELVVDVPDSGPSACVMADKDKLQQILLNLVSNAMKFTPPGGRITISVGDRDETGRVPLRVSDTGIGIPADRLLAVFEPFVQIGRALNKPSEGTGLGLAISRDLARGMGGELTVSSEEGSGSTFTLLLKNCNREVPAGLRAGG